MSTNFNALNGPELLKYILTKIEEKLESTGEFLPNITFPWVKFDFEVKVLVYPKQAMTDTAKLIVKGSGVAGELVDRDWPANPPTTIIEFNAKSSEVIDIPDQARVDSGQPVPTTTPGTKGVLVDKPVEMKVPSKGK